MYAQYNNNMMIKMNKKLSKEKIIRFLEELGCSGSSPNRISHGHLISKAKPVSRLLHSRHVFPG
jgi:hypothetical protein